jgi:hypothetical protein
MKIGYKHITFDSELEVNYYKYLEELKAQKEVVLFCYHPKPLEVLGGKYTPDFIVEDRCKIIVVETKGYNQFSFQRDTMIHRYMSLLSPEKLREYVNENSNIPFNQYKPVVYQKIKYSKKLKKFVDWSYKDRTQKDALRDKVKLLEQEIKELKEFKKCAIKYMKYKDRAKLTEAQSKAIEYFLDTVKKESL